MIEWKKKVLSQSGWSSLIVEGQWVSKEDGVIYIQSKEDPKICVSLGHCQIDDLIEVLTYIKEEMNQELKDKRSK